MSKERKSPASSFIELVVIVVTALALALLIQAFLVKPYRIPSPSMVPTLAIGQRVLVDRIGTHFAKPGIGDIVVFHPPAGADDESAGGQECGSPSQGSGHPQPCDKPTSTRSKENFIKRVVGLPGDRIAIVGGHVMRNGRREKDGYIRPCKPDDDCDYPQPITVPPDHYFMMGDNRGESADSRYWGPVPRDWIIGAAFATYWPVKRIGLF